MKHNGFIYAIFKVMHMYAYVTIIPTKLNVDLKKKKLVFYTLLD